jgi:hypothetical protein
MRSRWGTLMTSTEEAMGQSPLISVWRKPRRTIETVLNRGSGRGLWLLVSLNAMSSFAMALAASGFAKLLLDWRILFGAAAASVVGIAGLYIVLHLWGDRPHAARSGVTRSVTFGARVERAAGHSWLFYRFDSRPRVGVSRRQKSNRDGLDHRRADADYGSLRPMVSDRLCADAIAGRRVRILANILSPMSSERCWARLSQRS